MKIVAIRHTSVAVDPGICYGQTDVPVANSFQKEKDTVAAEIDGVLFDKMYSSPLTRCKLLAKSLFEKEKIVFDDRLKELNFGDWELQSWDEIYADPQGKVWMDNYQNLPALNGESYPEMVKRVAAFLDGIKHEKYNCVAIVAHAGVIRILKSLIDKQPIDELFKTFKPEYGSVTEFKI
ncbi:alpha-ribazole phosphatase [Prolixibacteraceae bacterium Z1-6]|uniref:Alpha-ribazole phosphatase n=1 Tax=Draconibacterium aestuarii TaxID=2998507 RepID=A0A9X3J6Y3_9BACT|nr:alpha-ribazole phosphatase [Prolixibacteraceae bacterium Z1-6]